MRYEIELVLLTYDRAKTHCVFATKHPEEVEKEWARKRKNRGTGTRFIMIRDLRTGSDRSSIGRK